MLDKFIKMFRLLLPKGRAWNIDLSNYFRQVIAGMMNTANNIAIFFVGIKNDVYPDTTTQIDLWEEQFALPPINNLTLQQRRDRLAARWSAQGGQSVSYIEQVLLTLGINAKIYENFNVYLYRCGDNKSYCGGIAYCSNGSALDPRNFLTLNEYLYRCGMTSATCGSGARCSSSVDLSGNLLVNGFIPNKNYDISSNPNDWIYYWIMADPYDINVRVKIPIELKDILRTVLLQIKPTHTRGILYVDYT